MADPFRDILASLSRVFHRFQILIDLEHAGSLSC